MPVIPRFSLALSTHEISSAFKGCLGLEPVGEEEIRKFEEEFARFLGVRFAFFLPSARVGLYLILKNMGLREGSGVIIPAWTHPSVPGMVVAAGAQPIFVDVEEGSLNINPEAIPEGTWRQAKAIIPTHLYGCPCRIDEIANKAKEFGLKVIEDCAQSCGGEYKGKKLGSFGDAAYFSFALTKNFTTMGGGMVVTSDEALAQRIREDLVGGSAAPGPLKQVLKAVAFKLGTDPIFFALTIYPVLLLFSLLRYDPLHVAFEEKFEVEKPGVLNRRPSPVQARLGLSQLQSLEKKNGRRFEAGKFLAKHLQGIPGVKLPLIPEDGKHIFMSFVLRVRNRRDMAAGLLRRGVDTSPGYLRACFQLAQFSSFRRDCPVALEAEAEQLHIPIYPGLGEKHLLHIAESLEKVNAKVGGTGG